MRSKNKICVLLDTGLRVPIVLYMNNMFLSPSLKGVESNAMIAIITPPKQTDEIPEII